MSSESRNQREKLKEEYKEHYRKMRETRERLKQTQKKKNIVDALKSMDSSELMESFDSFLFDVKSKVANAEARLDIVLGNLDDEDAAAVPAENEETFNRMKAKETLKQLKTEMGMLYSELERQAEAMDVEKTIGQSPKQAPDSSSSKQE